MPRSPPPRFSSWPLAAENPTEINPTLQAIDDPQDPTAQYILGHKYAYGRGKPRDYAKALKWFRRAADQGLILAQVRLAATHGNQACGAGLRDNLETQMTADQIAQALAAELHQRIKAAKTR